MSGWAAAVAAVRACSLTALFRLPRQGLSPLAAVEAVQAAIDDSTAWANVMVCALRSLPPSHSEDMARLAVDTGACGFDIAGDEQLYPLSLHAEALRLCRARDMPMSLHAGEWPGSLANVRTAIEAGVARIGHGIALAEDDELMAQVRWVSESGVAVSFRP